MAGKNRELEVKFLVEDLQTFARLIEKEGARKVQERAFEYNLRFDTPQGELAERHHVLRLRRDIEARLTFKAPGDGSEDVYARREIEFTVEDFDAARALLEALGYEVSVIYEKYREVYRLDKTLVTLDEMPFGHFIEIEGPSPEEIHAVADLLGLDWEARVVENYLDLFDRVRESFGLTFQDLTFENFRDLAVNLEGLNLSGAN
jgi:adenylate cyclase class 2